LSELPLYHPTGALYLPEAAAVLVADLHLGYGLTQRRRGQLGPVADTKTAEKLQSVLDELRPKRLILLGDAVHAPNPGAMERGWVAEQIRTWKSVATVIFIRGNHDRKIASDYGVEVVDQLTIGDWICVHGDAAIPLPGANQTVVMGHLHPAIGISDGAGVRQRVPVFLRGPQVLVLPAFSPFAAGLDVKRSFPAELLVFGKASEFQACAVTGRRVVDLGPISKIPTAASGSRPSDFRKLS
jgi:hypothetical protein